MDEKKREARIDISKILFRLIVALTCFIPVSVFALGVGQVKVLSALNQPLNAEIPLLSATADDLAGLNVRVSSQTFEGVGGADAEFNHAIETRGKSHFIRITSRQAIREPLLNFLLEIEWPKGRLLREFAILLNPPGFVTRTEPDIAPPAIPPTPKKEPSKRTRPTTSRTAQVAQPSEPAPKQPAPEPITGVDTGSNTFSGTYGPVRRGETLWDIAEKVRPDPSISVSRMMQALLQNNRQAFVTNNANTLMAGATLQIPVIDGLASNYQNTMASQESSASQTSRSSVGSEQNKVAMDSSTPSSASDNTSQVVNLSSSEPMAPSDSEALDPGFQISLNEDRLNLGLVDLDVLRDRIKNRIQEANDEDRPLTEFLPESLDDENSSATEEAAVTTENNSESTTDDLAAMSSSEAPSSEITSPEMASPEMTSQEMASQNMGENTMDTAESSSTSTDVVTSEETAGTPVMSADNIADTQTSGSNTSLTGTSTDESAEENSVMTDEASSTTTTNEDASAENNDDSGQQEIVVIDNGSDTSTATETAETTNSSSDLQQSVALDTAETGSSDWMGKFIQFTNDPLGALGDFSSVFDDPVMLPAVGGGVVLLLLLLWLLLRRSKKSEASEGEEDLAFEPIVQLPSDNNQDRSAFDDQHDMSSDEATQPSQPRPFRPATNPIERVDLLLAVGNYREAENVARLALADDPNNADLLAKMLDIHYAAGNAEKFQEGAETLRKNIEDEDSDPRWRNAMEMGRQLCPDYPLFSESGADTMVLNPDDDDSLLADDDDFDNHRTSTIESSVLRAHNLSEGFNASGPEDTESTLLMDTDHIGFDDNEPVSSDEVSLPDESADNILDFDTGLDFSDTSPEDVERSITDDLSDSDSSGAPADDFQGLDFDFDSFDDNKSDEADDISTAATSLEDDQFSDSLDFESLLPDSPKQEDASPARSDTANEDDLDSSMQDLEFSFEEVSTDGNDNIDDLNLGDFDLDSIGGDEESSSSGLIFDDETLADSGDNVETKLELAAAYLDMDDAEGARSLLEEVAQEGDSQQQQRAQEMLERLPS